MNKHKISICLSLLLTIILQIHPCRTTECANSDDESPILRSEQKLRNDLLCSYNKYFVPLQNRSELLEVNMAMTIYNYEITFSYPTKLIMQTRIVVKWADTFLKWDPQYYESISEIYINTDDIWVPEIRPEYLEFFESEESILTSTDCKVSHLGNVTCDTEGSHFGFCETDIATWPYNVHSCGIQYIIWSQNNEKMVINKPENETLIIKNNNEYKMELADTYSQYMKPNKNTFVYEMYYYFDVQGLRDPTALFRVSLIGLSAITLLCFWTNFDETGRLIMLLINLLVHFTEMQNMEWQTPQSGHTIPYMLAYYRDSMILTFVAIFETLLFIKILRSEKPLPVWIEIIERILGKNIIKKILFVEDSMVQNVEEFDITMLKQNTALAKKKQVLLLVDRLSFVIIATAYFIIATIFTSASQ